MALYVAVTRAEMGIPIGIYIDFDELVYPIGITNINYIDALLMPYRQGRARGRPRPICGDRGAVRPRGRGAVPRVPRREGSADRAGPGPRRQGVGNSRSGKYEYQ